MEIVGLFELEAIVAFAENCDIKYPVILNINLEIPKHLHLQSIVPLGILNEVLRLFELDDLEICINILK